MLLSREEEVGALVDVIHDRTSGADCALRYLLSIVDDDVFETCAEVLRTWIREE